MSPLLVVLAAAIARIGAVHIADEAALVQIHKTSSELSRKGAALKEAAGKQFVIEVDAEVFRRRDHIDCMLESDLDKVCHETGFDVKINGRTLTFVFRPGQPYIRIDGTFHTEQLGWSPNFSTRKNRADEAHHPTEHRLIITLRSTGIHTLQFVDGKDEDKVWEKDFHHAWFFPETDRAIRIAKVKTMVKNKNLRNNEGHYKCYSGYNEVHCMVLRRFGPTEDMPAPYGSLSHIPHVTSDFAYCNTYGDPHYLTFKEKRHHFQGIGTYTLSKSAKYDMTVQVFNCPLQRRPPRGGFVSLTAGIVIKIGDYYKISKVGPNTKLISQAETRLLPPDEYVKLPDQTEVDPAPNFLAVKGKVNLQGEFVEVEVKLRKNRNSLTGYALRVTSFLPTGDVDTSSGLCMSNKNNAFMTAVPPEENLFPKEDLDILTEACCPGGNCEPPEGPEPDYKAETLCEMCPNELAYATVKAACAEENEDNAALIATCEFDACMECDLEDALEANSDEKSAEGEDNDGPEILGTGGIGTSEADPHCRNIRGESFDILRMGPMQMVALPMAGEKRASMLDITAVVIPITMQKKCSPTTIQRVDIRGSWLPNFLLLSIHPTESGILEVPQHWQDWMARPNASKGNLTLHVDTWKAGDTHKSVLLLKVGPVQVTIHQRKGAHTGTNYLDLNVKGLDQVGQEVGGLLGLDNHDEVEASLDGCQVRDMAVRLDREEVDDEDLTEEDFENIADSMHDHALAGEGDGRLISVATAM